MSSLGGAPPPPPPPFKFPGMVIPQPKPPPSVVSEPAVPTMAAIQKAGMPAALAGAMMKDKKPFTYTPGGLDLSEIKSPSMQRRLQRNATLEGVRPSPLAQQASPVKSSSPLPPQGMIQVLPMPGVGMAPVVKPQAKETPKSKRNVCGPAPLPPPFSCGANGVEPVEIENITNNISTSPKPQNNIDSYPKSQSTIPTNSLDSEGSTEKNISDSNSTKITDIPIPPPPPTNTKFIIPVNNKNVTLTNNKIDPQNNNKNVTENNSKENLDNYIDLTELENTINSFTNNLDAKEDRKVQIDSILPVEESGTNESIVDCTPDVTDCSSPFYPEEQNSVQNFSDQSQDITSSSDLEHNIEHLPKKSNPNNSRWNPQRTNINETEHANQTEINNLELSKFQNSFNEINPNLTTVNVSNVHPVVIATAKKVPVTPEVVNVPLPVDDDIAAMAYSNMEAINYIAPKSSIAPPHSTDSSEKHVTISRQSSLPTNSMAKIINRSMDSGISDVKGTPNIYESKHNSYEKQSLDVDKPLPWMVGIKNEPSPIPDFVQRANNTQQRIQRQRSLPQSNETPVVSAPWRYPNHKTSNSPNRNRSISPNSMHINSSGQSYIDKDTTMDTEYRPITNQTQYATLPSNHRNKCPPFNFQNNVIQQNSHSQHKERIIPITLEATPPVTPENNLASFNLNTSTNIPSNFNSHKSPSVHSYGGHPYPNNLSNAACNLFPFSPTNSINATEALQQIQHNLNKLNNGLKIEETYSQNGPTPHQGINVVITSDGPPLQSKSFQVIQKAYETPRAVDLNVEEPRKYTASNIPSRTFKVLQAMTESPGYPQNYSNT